LRDKRFSDPVCSLCSGAIGANTQLRFLCFRTFVQCELDSCCHLPCSRFGSFGMRCQSCCCWYRQCRQLVVSSLFCMLVAGELLGVSSHSSITQASAIPSEMDASTLAERIRGFVRSVGGNVKSAIPQTPGTPSAVQRPIAGTTPASAQRVPITAAAAAAAAAASSPVAPPDVVGAHTPEQDPIGRGSLVGHHPAAPVLPGSALPASTPPTPIVVPPPAAPPSGSAAVLLPSPPTTMPGVSPVVVLESGASFVGRAPVPLRSVDSPLRSSASGGGVVAGFASSVPVRRGRDADEVSVVVDGDDEEKVHAPPAALGCVLLLIQQTLSA
jgi:hypothetical protein